MIHHIDTAIAAVATVGSAILGSQVSKAASSIIADSAAVSMPEWLQWAIGPAGALVGLIFALRWMAGRLDKAEEKVEAREKERDEDRKRLIEVLIDNTNTNKNTQVFIDQTRQAIERCTSVVNGCHERK